MTERRTSRLLLRRWRPDDLDAFAALCADPEVMRFVGRGRPLSREESAAAIARFEQGWERHGYGLWAAQLELGVQGTTLSTRRAAQLRAAPRAAAPGAAGPLIGFVGLARPDFLPEVLPAPEVGFRLARAYWGRGLATEGARAALAYAFDDLGVDRVVSIRHRDNAASGRVMEKVGLRHDRDTPHPTLGLPLVVTAISREEWRGRA